MTRLIRTPHGWAYPDPGPCSCGETAARRGWEFCRCAGASGGGHPSWRCAVCDEVRALGCTGRVAVLNEYGARAVTVLLRKRNDQASTTDKRSTV